MLLIGAAAISYVIEALASGGGHIVAQKDNIWGTYNLVAHTLVNYGITTTFVNIHDLSEVENAIEMRAKAVYIENPR